jgi:ribosomal protein S18 acetylase RimI-like enzyme
VIAIRPLEDRDWDAVWAIIEPVFRAGETYAYARDITERQAHQVWVDQPAATYVAVDEAGAVLGSYVLKANQPGQGAHVCNCGYIVGENARGRGVASRMCAHSQDVARGMGFRAMQYNFVAASNEGAVRLWQSLGFDIVGTLPGAFNHPRHGFVDAYVMFKTL